MTVTPAELPIRLSPNRTTTLAELGHPLTQITPETRLGKAALDLAQTTTAQTLNLAAATSYFHAVANQILPDLKIYSAPAGTSLNATDVQTAYDEFKSLFNTLQTGLSGWFSAAEEGNQSLLGQVIAAPAVAVQYNTALTTTLNHMINHTADSKELTIAQMKEDMQAAANAINTTQTNLAEMIENLTKLQASLEAETGENGNLVQVVDAYETAIQSLQSAVDSIENKIENLQAEIKPISWARTKSFKATLDCVDVASGPAGLILFLLGTFAVWGLTVALRDIDDQIASLEKQIKQDELWEQDDAAAAAIFSMLRHKLVGSADMANSVSDQLSQLNAFYTTLSNELATIINELSQDETSAALQEWNEIYSNASVLYGITAYLWPSPALVSNPRLMLGHEGTLYVIDSSGEILSSTAGAGDWTSLGGTGLSLARTDDGTLYAIQGAPISSRAAQPTTSSNYGLMMMPPSGSWGQVGTTPIMQLTTSGTEVYYISQAGYGQEIQGYAPTGSIPVPSLPNGDLPHMLVNSDGFLYAIGVKARSLYSYDLNGGLDSWNQLGDAWYRNIAGSGGSIIAINDSGDALFITNGSLIGHSQICTDALKAVPVPNGGQYIIKNDHRLYYNADAQSPDLQALTPGVLDMCVDGEGHVYLLETGGQIWQYYEGNYTQFPAFP